ncbi:hypothetical protein Corgl_0637 [Coriobacterium glomerans PW2]|uniref:Uncharacterized protein n=1 Tax=Coriobacterium glomerans (strain ATCC 49209 / DSM 20642 / JCM 10262 / PW2) TaxID=700015 RepID=F2NBL5_CORGP|nr:hypothetical protein [Coriobacterium glomerans]AEB06751.1 hypothetical protein Corgl_0637 [Coriobacterium glomerans PW2]
MCATKRRRTLWGRMHASMATQTSADIGARVKADASLSTGGFEGLSV